MGLSRGHLAFLANFREFKRGVPENLILLRCDVMLLGKCFPKFRRRCQHFKKITTKINNKIYNNIGIK